MSDSSKKPLSGDAFPDLDTALAAIADNSKYNCAYDEGQRQMILLALQKLREERPGWDYAIGEIEKQLGGQLDWSSGQADQLKGGWEQDGENCLALVTERYRYTIDLYSDGGTAWRVNVTDLPGTDPRTARTIAAVAVSGNEHAYRVADALYAVLEKDNI